MQKIRGKQIVTQHQRIWNTYYIIERESEKRRVEQYVWGEKDK